MTENNGVWARMQFKGNKVWVCMEEEGQPLTKNGKFLIKYQLDQPHEYWVHGKNVMPLDNRDNKRPKPTKRGRTPAPKRNNDKRAINALPQFDPRSTICIYTDGASSGNPGPSGIGVLLCYGEHEKEISRFIGNATNNIAELEAIRTALLAVKNRSLPVRVFTDSSYAYGLLVLGWKPKKNQQLVTSIRKLLPKFQDLQFIKVKGHAGHAENERADFLATSAIERKN